MSLYDYVATDDARACDHCRGGFEARHAMSDPPLERCPQCNAPVKRAITAPGICTRPGNTKAMLSDKNLKEKGFKKLVNEGNGTFRDVL